MVARLDKLTIGLAHTCPCCEPLDGTFGRLSLSIDSTAAFPPKAARIASPCKLFSCSGGMDSGKFGFLPKQIQKIAIYRAWAPLNEHHTFSEEFLLDLGQTSEISECGHSTSGDSEVEPSLATTARIARQKCDCKCDCTNVSIRGHY